MATVVGKITGGGIPIFCSLNGASFVYNTLGADMRARSWRRPAPHRQ
jgi:hypothetical protein